MELGLTAQTALVTGAAQGLGRAIAQALYEAGANVVLGDVNRPGIEQAAREHHAGGERALAVELDVRDEDAFRGAFDIAAERFGTVQILVNNAARTAATPLWEISREEWDDVLATNLRGIFFGCRLGGERMRESGFGRIVNLASIAGQWGRGLTGGHYAASKAGIVGLTRLFAIELAPLGVTVNAVAPAAIDGPAVQAMPADRIAAFVESNIPVRRLGRPEEVADLVAFLASDRAGFITGATIDINGGALMR
jgi:3-oxoacyl-[acyl-carrier protein] reductase